MANFIRKIIRQIDSSRVVDPSTIQSHTYNEAAGAQKNMDMGHHLLPIFDAGSYKTNLTTATGVGKGKTIAIYNNSGSALSATVGDSTVTAQAIGAVQAGTDHVGIALKPNEWTYIATNDKDFVITNSANAICYIVSDETYITNQKIR